MTVPVVVAIGGIVFLMRGTFDKIAIIYIDNGLGEESEWFHNRVDCPIIQ
jgi:hypothetical protein